MSSFTREVMRNTAEIRKHMIELLQKERVEDDKYIKQIQDAAKQRKVAPVKEMKL
jgi:hypothetical protein